MFTLNIYLRFALIALFLPAAVLLNIYLGFWYAFPLYLVLPVLILSYIFLGTVQSAANLMQSGDFQATDKRLDLTLKPDWLYVTNRAYYYLLRGSVHIGQKRIEEGEVLLKKAQSIPLPSDNERGMILLQLANIAASKNKWKEGEMYLRQIKAMKITDGSLKEQVKNLERAVGSQGQMKAAMRMGGAGGSQVRMAGSGKGKRRRPPMR